jgi:CubicO group peptidase (beta-lactamase class C family)
VTTQISDRLRAVLERAPELGVAGSVVGVAVGDAHVELAYGSANLNTGQAFTEDTGWLLGSVTKLLTTTTLLRLVDRGAVELDAPVQGYVPEFDLADREAAARITVRMLVNHTNGIDADTLFPAEVRGRDASKAYTAYLPQLGVVFEPGSGIHYTNPGFSLAARVIEEQNGLTFERAIQRELFDTAGMHDSTALQTQGFLRRTAVGAIRAADGAGLRAVPVFTLGEEAAGAGSSPLSTVGDMLAFGRMHLNDGVAPNGRRVLSADLARAMRTQTYDLGIPQAPPIGLGWWFMPICGVTAYWHGGGSPGGTSSFCVIPELDAVIVSFSTGPGSSALNDLLHTAVVEELTGRSAEPPLDLSPEPLPVDAGLAGEYVSFQKRLTVEVQGEELELMDEFVPYDAEHRKTLEDVWSSGGPPSPVRYRRVAEAQYLPAATDPGTLAGFYGRMALVASLPAAAGRGPGLHTRFRFVPRAVS